MIHALTKRIAKYFFSKLEKNRHYDQTEKLISLNFVLAKTNP